MSVLDMDEILGEAGRIAQQNSQGDNQNFDSPYVPMPKGAGHITVRILPPAFSGAFNREKSPLFQATRLHKVNNKSFHCPNVRQKSGEYFRWVGDCPICAYYRSLYKRADKLDEESQEYKKLVAKAREIKPIERYYYNVIIRQQFNSKTNQVETNVGPKILSVGISLHSKIVTGITGNKEMDEAGFGDVTDVTGKTGRDFKIIKKLKKEGGNEYPEYDDSKFLDPSPLSTDKTEIKGWMDSLHDLVALRTLEPTSVLEKNLKIHNGVLPDESGDFDPSQFEVAEGSVAAGQANTAEEPAVEVEVTAPVTKAAVKAAPAKKVAAAPVAPPVVEAADDASGEDESMDSKAFLEKLRNM